MEYRIRLKYEDVNQPNYFLIHLMKVFSVNEITKKLLTLRLVLFPARCCYILPVSELSDSSL